MPTRCHPSPPHPPLPWAQPQGLARLLEGACAGLGIGIYRLSPRLQRVLEMSILCVSEGRVGANVRLAQALKCTQWQTAASHLPPTCLLHVFPAPFPPCSPSSSPRTDA